MTRIIDDPLTPEEIVVYHGVKAAMRLALEADRKGLMDDKLPHRDGVSVELADLAIRLFAVAGRMKLDLAEALIEKNRINRVRIDHQIGHRAGPNGKRY